MASTSGNRNGSRWYEIQDLNATPSLVQSGTVFDSAASNPKSYWIPTIMVSGQGHAVMGCSTAGATNRINAGTVGRLAGDTSDTMQTPVDYTASSTAYFLKQIAMRSRSLKPDSVGCRPINQQPIRAEMALTVGTPVSV